MVSTQHAIFISPLLYGVITEIPSTVKPPSAPDAPEKHPEKHPTTHSLLSSTLSEG